MNKKGKTGNTRTNTFINAPAQNECLHSYSNSAELAFLHSSTNNSKAEMHLHYFLTSFFLVSDQYLQTKERHFPPIHLLQEQPRLPPHLLLHQPAGGVSHGRSMHDAINSRSWMTWTKYSSRNQPVKDDRPQRKHARGLAA